MDAADIFQKESNTKPGVDLAAITDRMEIRKAVQSGDIQQAIERVNDLNPEVSGQSLRPGSLDHQMSCYGCTLPLWCCYGLTPTVHLGM